MGRAREKKTLSPVAEMVRLPDGFVNVDANNGVVKLDVFKAVMAIQKIEQKHGAVDSNMDWYDDEFVEEMCGMFKEKFGIECSYSGATRLRNEVLKRQKEIDDESFR